MSSDRHLRERLRRAADAVETDVEHELQFVRRRERQLRIRRRILAGALAVAAVLALVSVRGQIADLADTFREQPATPGPTTISSVANPFSIQRRIDLATLGIRHPLRLAVGPDGNLYITDAGQTVSVVTPAGDLLQRWGKPGTRPGEFRLVQGAIAVGADGLVYVSDTGNFRVQVFTSDGTFVREFGSFGTGPGEFQSPFDLTVDNRGNTYVADDHDATVSRFSPTGRFVWRLGGANTTQADLIGHEHLDDVDHLGRIVMANDDAGRIVYVDRSGRLVDAFGSSSVRLPGGFPNSGDFPGGACNVSVDPLGDTVVQGCEEPTSPTHTTRVFDASHHLVGEWTASPFAWSPRFGPNGELWALSYDGALLQVRMTLPT